jgi:hypothetical protein
MCKKNISPHPERLKKGKYTAITRKKTTGDRNEEPMWGRDTLGKIEEPQSVPCGSHHILSITYKHIYGKYSTTICCKVTLSSMSYCDSDNPQESRETLS